MKSITLILFALAFAFSFRIYGQKVPPTWKHTMVLKAGYHGGHSPYSYDLVITDTLSSMTEISDKGQKIYKKTFTQKDLDALLAFLKTHHFDQIKNEQEHSLTYDKGSESVSLKWDFNLIIASETAYSSLQDKYRDDFNVIQNYVKILFRKER